MMPMRGKHGQACLPMLLQAAAVAAQGDHLPAPNGTYAWPSWTSHEVHELLPFARLCIWVAEAGPNLGQSDAHVLKV
eukprot:scaffold266732_cov15-Tisochrysis_lutea.AAC.1